MSKFKQLIKSPILALWLTVFIDLVGLGIVIPIFATLFFEPGAIFFGYSVTFLGLTIDTALLYGLMVAVYPIAQFFGAPLIGDLSDKYGRKKMLILSITGTLLGYLVVAVGILQGSLALLFLGRVIDGFTGGNISVAQSSISDLSTKETKARNFGLIGMAFGFGFVIGPYLGGKLADPSIVSWFNAATPFFFSAILAFINIVLLTLNYKETLKEAGSAKFNFLGGLKNLHKAITVKELRNIFMVTFIFIFGFNFFAQFFQVYLIERFQFTSSNIGDLFAYIGLWIAFTQGVILRPLTKRFGATQIPQVTLFLLGVAFFLLLIPDSRTGLFLVMPLVAMFNGLTQPNLLTIVSGLADNTTQGEVLGINQSVQSVAQAVPPIIAGLIASVSTKSPIVVAGLMAFLAWALFVKNFRSVKLNQQFHD